MSHQVQIDYEAIAIRCESICEVAERRIAELDQILSDIENGSQSLQNSQTAALQEPSLSQNQLTEKETNFIGVLKNC